MPKSKNWLVLIKALCEQMERWPLATLVSMEKLAELSPIIEVMDGCEFIVAGVNEVFDFEDIDEAEIEVQAYMEDKGFYVGWDYDLGISIHEYVDPSTEFIFEDIEYLVLTYSHYLDITAQSKVSYDGDTLRVAPENEELFDCRGLETRLDEEGKTRLKKLIDDVGLRLWKREYEPIGCMVYGGWYWGLTIRFRNGKVFASRGDNAWPETLGFFWEGLFEIVGLEVPSGDERPMWVCELVGQGYDE